MIEHTKQVVRSCMRMLARVLNSISGGRITPNGVTLFGLFMHIPIAILIAMRLNYWAAVLLFIFGLFDTLDGELARLQKRETSTGRLLDSVTDRVKEILLYIGVSYALIANNKPYLAVWVAAAVGCSLLTSYINAAGDSAMAAQKIEKHATNKTFRGGLFPFEIRMFILFIALLTNFVWVAVIIIAVGAGYTAFSRMMRVLNTLKHAHASN